MAARRAHNPKVVGSNPTAAIFGNQPLFDVMRPANRETTDHNSYGGIAQLVEQPAHTRYVPGSTPGTASYPAAQHGSNLPREQQTASIARLRRAVSSACDRGGVIEESETVLIACSGGPDSTALLDALARLAPPRKWLLHVVHVDHGLRSGSEEEAEVVAQLARDHELGFTPLSVNVEKGASLQDRAREARYAGLNHLADELGASAIALGHTADDQAETVLMRLLSGGTSRSLEAMAPRRGRLARPLLGVWREDTIQYCVALGIEPLQDPSNLDPRFRRSRIRNEALPLLESIYPGAKKRLVALAKAEREFRAGGG